jgi:Bacterial regulatory helix-turn-helix protein, lysR family
MLLPPKPCVNAILGIVTIRQMNIEGVDLNLLGPLAALLEERHVSRAAERQHMSQPAMSRALRELRIVFDDELLVRSAGAYQLTPRAERLQRELAETLPRCRQASPSLRFRSAATVPPLPGAVPAASRKPGGTASRDPVLRLANCGAPALAFRWRAVASVGADGVAA